MAHWIADGPNSCTVCSTREAAVATLVNEYGQDDDPKLFDLLAEFGQCLLYDDEGVACGMVEVNKCGCWSPNSHHLMAVIEGRERP